MGLFTHHHISFLFPSFLFFWGKKNHHHILLSHNKRLLAVLQIHHHLRFPSQSSCFKSQILTVPYGWSNTASGLVCQWRGWIGPKASASEVQLKRLGPSHLDFAICSIDFCINRVLTFSGEPTYRYCQLSRSDLPGNLLKPVLQPYNKIYNNRSVFSFFLTVFVWKQ